MYTNLLLLPLAMLPALSRADFSLNNPVAGTKWQAGKEATVSWIPAGSGYNTSADVKIELMRGDPAHLNLVQYIGTTKETDGTYTFIVPDTYQSADDYSVRIGDKYSHSFSVDNPSMPSSSGSSSGNSTDGSNGTPTSNKNATATSRPTTTATNQQNAATVLNAASSFAALIPVAILTLVWF